MDNNIGDFETNVFINCPFDLEYRRMLHALIFTLIKYGLEPRIALILKDSGVVRIDKIKEMIEHSKFSIHDISRMEFLKDGDSPRFNLPFELGLDFGCRFYGADKLKDKNLLILEEEKFRYREVISDISGNDVEAHNSKVEAMVRLVWDWYCDVIGETSENWKDVWYRFNEFQTHFEKESKESGFDDSDIENISIKQYIELVKIWLGKIKEQEEVSSR